MLRPEDPHALDVTAPSISIGPSRVAEARDTGTRGTVELSAVEVTITSESDDVDDPGCIPESLADPGVPKLHILLLGRFATLISLATGLIWRVQRCRWTSKIR